MLEELTGYPYEVSGPIAVEGLPLDLAAYGWQGMDTRPTGAEWLCNIHCATEGECAAIVLMDLPEAPDDLPDGWRASAYGMADDWTSDDGVWIVKAIHQKGDGSWIFAGYCR